MPPRSPATNAPPATPPSLDAARRTSAPSASALNLSSIALLALGLFVFLWGFGYKLSLYHQQNPESRVPSAKLWLEPGTERNLHLPARAYALAVPHTNAVQPGPLPLRDLGRAAFPAVDHSPRFAFQALLPSRAPPVRASSGSCIAEG